MIGFDPAASFPLLAIESSCDETAAAVVDAGGAVRADVVRSQIDDHKLFGGVVPELASRCHLESIDGVVAEALERAALQLDELRGVAVTAGPGLVGSLLVGLSWAQGFATARGLPILGVNHLEGHLLAPFVDTPAPPFPFLGLVVSGGHTSLVLARGLGDYEILGETRDDAAGEAFDKSARVLGLPYPGGVHIDRIAQGGDPHAVTLPRGMRGKPGYDLSFSGLKTAVWRHVEEHGRPVDQGLADLCASIQEAIVDALLIKTRKAARDHGVQRVVVSGGVAANSGLRARFAAVASEEGWELHRPPLPRCTDNASMIGYVAALRMARGERSGDSLDVRPSWALGAPA